MLQLQLILSKIYASIKGFIVHIKKNLPFYLILFTLLFGIILFGSIKPSNLFKKPFSTVLYDKDSNLLAAHIAEDGQWRFETSHQMNKKLIIALLLYEDERFFHHNGVDFKALVRAAVQNIRQGHIVSGGSTLTMQVVRIARGNKERTFSQKIIEILIAMRLELSYSKSEILSLYLSNAPFGGNVVGLETAAWRYYGKTSKLLSWGEIATLAVLPNSPSLIFPGKNQEKLKKKRNALLDKLHDKGFLDENTCQLAKTEPLPQKPLPLPQKASALMTRLMNEGYKGQSIYTSIDSELQDRISKIVNRHCQQLKQNHIHNAAALILDVESGNALCYIGNVESKTYEHGENVDIISSRRSPGSILKPFLYAFMLNDGQLLPDMLVKDIPTQIAGYVPKNYDLSYNGAVPAHKALYRSLNIPAVRMLMDYGIERFNYNLKRIGITTLNKPASHYGLSIILGGSEVTMWDIASVYASMARTLKHYNPYEAKYNKDDFHPAQIIKKTEAPKYISLTNTGLLSASSIWYTFDAMIKAARPEKEQNWQLFSSSQTIAWKTGTSYGYRDAWCVGITPKYVVVVWTGNADGEGRADLVGIKSSAPLMFEIFKLLEYSPWFDFPYDDMVKIPICKQSGYIASPYCSDIDTVFIPRSGEKSKPCPYHYLIHLDKQGYQVNSACENTENMEHISWFVLPPAMEWYYKSRNPQYKTLPAFREDCKNAGQSIKNMEFIYPKQNAKIYVPVELNGSMSETVFEVAHRRNDAILYWHLDGTFMGTTNKFHQLGLRPTEGEHLITVIDEKGESLIQKFYIIGEKEKQH